MKAVIIEDESIIAQELQNKIKLVAPDVKVIAVLAGITQAKQWLSENLLPDLLLMDIQLGDGVSFELFEMYPLNCPVIFTTAYDEYAVRAFKVNGVDYLLKPVDDDELKTAIDKCRCIIDSKSVFPTDMNVLIQKLTQSRQLPLLFKEKFIVNYQRKWMPIDTKDIACFMKDHLHYIFTFSGEKHILDFSTMEDIEELLNPQLFYRANRQYILHLDAIQTVQPHESQKLTVTLKPPLKIQMDISREKAPAFKKWLDR